jgi:sodium transport system permease protein
MGGVDMPRWREILTLYSYEIRSSLRERTIVVNSIIIPIVLYPAILWMTFTGFEFVRGQTADQLSRVMVLGGAGGSQELSLTLQRTPRFELVPPSGKGDAERAITAGSLDVLLDLEPTPSASLPDNVHARIVFDGTRERSVAARNRVQEALRSFRERRLREEAFNRGLSPGGWTGFALDDRNVASGAQMGQFLLAMMLPLFFVVMVSVGCFFPAIDSTAGERERGTWETLISTPAARTSIVTAKYLAVATFGCVAGLLNVAAMALTLGGVLAPMTGQLRDAVSFSVPLSAMPVLAVSAVLLAGFVAAGMMIFAAFARTFREGQTMIQPFYLAILLPTVFLSSRGTELTWTLAAAPIVNIALVTREALTGTYRPGPITLAFVVSVAAIAIMLRVATVILHSEDVMVGSYRGSFGSFARDRVRRTPSRRRSQ